MDRAARFGRISAALIVVSCSFVWIGVLAAQPPDAPKPAETADSSGPVAAPENPPTRKPADASSAPVTPDAKPADAKSRTQSSYVIGALDVLSIRVWNNPNLTGLVDVRPDGMITVPLVGEVKADGLTPEELKELLTKKIAEFITDPEVTIDVAKINSKKYYIMGEGAAHTGPVPLTEPITVLQALATAGGFQTFANLKKIYVLRGTQKLYFNYKDVSQGKHLEQNIQIQNGDMIFIQ